MGLINIGFENDPILDEYEMEEKSSDQASKQVKPKKSVYLSPKRLEAIKSEYDCVVVHEFGDEYHLSDEERQAKNRYYNTFKVLKKAKRTYRKIDEYVKVMRDALTCLDAVAQNNGLYSPEEFKKLYFRDKIYINGLKLPKYKGRDRKDLSWEYIAEFILSGNDPKELLKNKNDTILTEEEIEDQKYLLFTPEEYQKIMESISDESKADELKYFDTDEDSQDGTNVVVALSDKESKKIIKGHPEILNAIKEIKRSRKSTDNLRSYAYELTADDIEMIEDYDRRHGYVVSSSEIPKFKGNLMNDKDYKLYMQSLDQYEDDNIKENYHGRLKTIGEIKELELKAVLEESGWNIRALYNNREKEKKLAKANKEDAKRMKKLKRQLTDIQNRQKRRMGDSDIGNSSGKKKKNKKKKKHKEYD